MILLYNLVIRIYHLGVRIAAFTNPKAAKWVKGRKGLLDKIEHEVVGESNLIWVHCASLGEFEQGRPIIERLKQQDPSLKLLLTFFSPSGFEVRKDYEHAAYVYYLPEDSKHNAQRFLRIVQPKAAIFIKYEYWLHYFKALQGASIPTFLVSARFRKDQVFFKWYGAVFRRAVSGLTKIFVQDESSQQLAQSIGIENSFIAGDTRYDRVVESVQNVQEIEDLKSFVNGARVLIGGSTWPVDEDFILPFINAAAENFKLILAPHQVDEEHIKEIENGLKVSHTRFSEIKGADLTTTRVVIIDNVGMLSNLYQYGHIAYVGGGFTGALHNILEPAAFGIPVLFGPKHDKFPEAEELVDLGGAFTITDGLDFVKRMAFLSDPYVVKIASVICTAFVKKRAGASDTIIQGLDLDNYANDNA